METKKTSKKPSTDNKGSPSLKEDLAKKDDAPAARQPAADPGEDPALKDTFMYGLPFVWLFRSLGVPDANIKKSSEFRSYAFKNPSVS